MANVGIHGYSENAAWRIIRFIAPAMYKIGLGDSVCEIIRSHVVSFGGDLITPSPFLRIFTPDFDEVPKILSVLESSEIYQDVEVISEKMMFFTGKEIASGEWRKKFCVEFEEV
jgi:hypothetical protein